MKKLALLGIIFTLVFVFTLALTLELYAFGSNPIEDPDPPPGGGNCCTYYTWCGSEGHGSLVPVKYYDPKGIPYWVLECRWDVQPSSPYYNIKCVYEVADACNAT